ncbi:response regulator transcription factor [Streptomyces sp. NPDC000594]|uniref:helix-turn-helix transcriptional regulator n=1 Tax=Streptomyces sp. NPDC000594 TaxID=3154261 RepID=UPI00331FFF89
MNVIAQRVTVTVHAKDPLSRAGVMSHLQRQPSVEVVRETATTTPPPPPPSVPARAARVAVMLIDRLDDPTRAELRRTLRAGGSQVVLIARELREPDLLTVVESGVRVILWRHQATEQRLLTAVHSAARGEGELPADLIGRLLAQMGRLQRSQESAQGAGAAAGPLFGMASREIAVVRLVAEGLDTRQISEKLAYSERTVKNILHALMTRLRLTNRAHAVAYALREGYI